MLSDFSVFYAVTESGIGYQVSNLLGYATGTLVSFGLQRKITFRTQDKTLIRLLLFISVACVGYAASAVLLWLLIELNGIDVRYSKLATLPIVALLQYLLNRSITFRRVDL